MGSRHVYLLNSLHSNEEWALKAMGLRLWFTTRTNFASCMTPGDVLGTFWFVPAMKGGVISM